MKCKKCGYQMTAKEDRGNQIVFECAPCYRWTTVKKEGLKNETNIRESK